MQRAGVTRTDQAQIIFSRGCRCGFAAIVTLQSAGGGFIVKNKCTATDPGRLGLNQTQDQLNGYGRVHRTAPLVQHATAGLSRQWIRRDGEIILRDDGLLTRPKAGGQLRQPGVRPQVCTND